MSAEYDSVENLSHVTSHVWRRLYIEHAILRIRWDGLDGQACAWKSAELGAKTHTIYRLSK